MAERVFFIINKYSGNGFEPGIDGKIIDACAAANLEGTIEFTRSRGHAIELAAQAVAQGFLRVFAMGGDGTVNEVACSLVNTSVSLGIIPSGSGNGLARHLRVPLVTQAALGQLTQYKTISMDTLRINGGLSVNVSGFGFDGHVASQFGKDGTRGLFGYAKLVLGEFLTYKEFDIRAEADG